MIMGRGSRSFLHLLFLVLVVRYTDGRVKSRWKRQVLPSTHVQVHSLNSNVSVSDTVKVVSAESRIDLDEKFLNASIWSTSSELLFDNFDTYVNYTAYNVEDVFKLQSIILQKKANRTQFSMVTNRTSDGETSFNERLDGSISLRVNDTNMGVQALNGSYALIDGQTWKENVPKKISVFSAIDDTDQERKLLIRAESHLYEVKIILNSAEVQIEYGPSMIQIDETYRHMKIFTNRRNITLDTTTSPFEVTMTENDLLVTCKDERTIATLSPNNTDVGISVGQYSRLEVDRGKGIMSLGSDAAISERVNVTSMHLQLDLEDDVIRANSNRSHIDMMGNLTKVGLTAAIHNLTVIGGVPRMILDTGNITIKVLTVEERAVLPSIVPPFITPKDNYDTLGPVQNETLNDRQSQGSEPNPFEEATENPEEKIQVTTLVANNEERLTSVAPELNDISSETSPEAKTTTVDNREVTSAITNPEESGVNGYDPFVQQIPDWLIHPTTTSLTSPIETTEWTDQSDSESTTGEADQTATSHQSETSPSAEIPTDAGPEETTFMPVTGEEGEIDQQTDAVNEARSIDQIYIETTTDGFVIGQFAQPEFNHKQPSATAQSNQGTKMEATIDKVEFFTQAPPFPTSPGQSPFPEPETLAKKRTSRSINDALVMRLFVPDTVNISDPLFRKAMQDNLITAVQESVCGGDKQKRSTDEQDIGINLTNIGRDGEALSLHFIVFDDISGLRTNHSAVAEAMNLLGVARLSQDMHYPVMEVVHVNLDSSLVWLSLASACSVLLIFLFVLIGWKFSVHQKIKRRIIDQKMSKRTEAFQQKADDYY